MPVDNLLSDTNSIVSSWNLFVAAMTQNGELCSHLVSRVHNRASFNTSSDVFPLNYDSSHGSTIQGAASPAQGAMYAPLALKAPILTINANPHNPSGTSPSRTGVIAGGIAAAVVFIIVIVVSAIAIRRRRRRLSRGRNKERSRALLRGPSRSRTPLPSPPSPARAGEELNSLLFTSEVPFNQTPF